MEKKETIGENPDGNMVIWGECVSTCVYLKEQGILVDLVYIDPPFARGADFAEQVYVRRNHKIALDDRTTVEIYLRDLQSVLDDVVIGDCAELHCELTNDGLFTSYTGTIQSDKKSCRLKISNICGDETVWEV